MPVLLKLSQIVGGKLQKCPPPCKDYKRQCFHYGFSQIELKIFWVYSTVLENFLFKITTFSDLFLFKIGLLRVNRHILQNATKQSKIAYCLPLKMYDAFEHWYHTDNHFEQTVIKLSLYLLPLLYPK